MRKLRARGFGVAVISASRNAERVLASAGVLDDFDAHLDGVVADELGLAAKPDPALFVEAVRRLHTEPARAAVVVDARAGVEAGRRGGFGIVIGVDRVGQADALLDAGADAVVHDLGEVDVTDWAPTRPIAELASARSSAAWATIRAQLAAGRPAVFCDFDGTLTPIIEDPDAVQLSPEMRVVLERLARVLPVAIVSGRDREDVAARVGIDRVVYAGSHGFDISAPGGVRFEHPGARAARPRLDDAASAIEAAIAGIDGAFVERKRYAVAVHYRRVARDRVVDVLEAYRAVADARPLLARSGGKMVVELRPKVAWDKGRALRWIGSEVFGGPGFVPVYIGDDLTDEDAFREIADDGVAVVVRGGDHASAPPRSLPDVREVAAFLAELAELAEGTTECAG